MLNFVFACFGAFLFSSLERDNEEFFCRKAKSEFHDFIETLDEYENGTYLVTPEHLKEKVKYIGFCDW